MVDSKKKGALVISFLILTLLISSCTKGYESNEFIKKDGTNENNIVKIDVDEKMETMDISDKDEKFKKTMDEVHEMKEGAMSKVKEMYTDLEFVKKVEKGNESNLVGMGAEDWLYSKMYDVTVIVCNSMNTPAYIINGQTLEGDELAKVKKMMVEMMEMMGEDGMMDMEHGDMGMMDDMEDDTMGMKDDDSMVKMEDDKKMEKAVESSVGVYTDYSANALSEAKGDIVLFFHADWCPTCVATEKDILKKGVPDNLTILNTNFDKELELKKKYGVVAQTTFVQVDNKGTLIKKWVGGRLADIIEKVGE